MVGTNKWNLPIGSTVLVMLGSGNLDPTEFKQPNSFELGRESKTTLTFGQGKHCKMVLYEIKWIFFEIVLENLWF